VVSNLMESLYNGTFQSGRILFKWGSDVVVGVKSSEYSHRDRLT